MNSGEARTGPTTSAPDAANPRATASAAGARCSDSPAAMEVTGPDWDLPATPTADAAEVDELTRELAQAYEQRSSKALARYFEKWELAATALPPESRANLDATTRAAYETFERIYREQPDTTIGGVLYQTLPLDGGHVVTWQRQGRTCILVGPVPAGELLTLASWQGPEL